MAWKTAKSRKWGKNGKPDGKEPPAGQGQKKGPKNGANVEKKVPDLRPTAANKRKTKEGNISNFLGKALKAVQTDAYAEGSAALVRDCPGKSAGTCTSSSRAAPGRDCHQRSGQEHGLSPCSPVTVVYCVPLIIRNLPKPHRTRPFLERCKGHTHKGHREKVLSVMNFRIFKGVFGVCSGYFQVFSGSFRVSFPMPFPGMPFGPFQLSEETDYKLEFERKSANYLVPGEEFGQISLWGNQFSL